MPLAVALGAAAVPAAAGVLGHRRIAQGDPEQTREANQASAQCDVAVGRTVVEKSGNVTSQRPQPRLWTVWHTLGTALGAVAPLLFLAPAGEVTVGPAGHYTWAYSLTGAGAFVAGGLGTALGVVLLWCGVAAVRSQAPAGEPILGRD
jgi:hypothetical protein